VQEWAVDNFIKFHNGSLQFRGSPDLLLFLQIWKWPNANRGKTLIFRSNNYPNGSKKKGVEQAGVFMQHQFLSEWLPYRGEYLSEILKIEAPPSEKNACRAMQRTLNTIAWIALAIQSSANPAASIYTKATRIILWKGRMLFSDFSL
jgi:hypothetical protein